MAEHTFANDPKCVEEERVPDASTLSSGCQQVLSDAVSRVVNLLEFRLCCGCQVPEC